MKNIIVLGATGSIGDSVLSVIKQNKNKLNLLGIAFSSNIAKAEDIINEFKLKNVYSESNKSYESLKHTFENNYELKWVQPIDQFLFSAHVELVAIFQLK